MHELEADRFRDPGPQLLHYVTAWYLVDIADQENVTGVTIPKGRAKCRSLLVFPLPR
jgi:hypothetical protein